jgi:hypothetical protein
MQRTLLLSHIRRGVPPRHILLVYIIGVQSHSFTHVSSNYLMSIALHVNQTRIYISFCKNNRYTFVHPCTDLSPPILIGIIESKGRKD